MSSFTVNFTSTTFRSFLNQLFRTVSVASMKWRQLEDAFFEIAKREISKILSENRDQTLYAVALAPCRFVSDGVV